MLTDDLKQVRRLKKELRQLCEERERLAPSIGSPRLDGLPHGAKGGMGARMEARIDLRTELDRRIRRTRQALGAAETRARAQMDGLPPELQSLCTYYYIGAMSVSEAAGILHISRTTFYRWMGDLESRDIVGQCGT